MKTIDELIPDIDLRKYMYRQFFQSEGGFIGLDGTPSAFTGSPNMYALLTNYTDWVNQELVAYQRYILSKVANLSDLDKFGVSVWSNILNLNTEKFRDPAELHPTFFGMDGKGVAFDQAPFQVERSSTLAAHVNLATAAKMMQLRYLTVMWDGSLTMLNAALANIFKSEGGVVAIDNLDMTMSYRYSFRPSDFQLDVLFSPEFADDYWPRPATVKISFEDFSVDRLGFDEKPQAKFDSTKLINR